MNFGRLTRKEKDELFTKLTEARSRLEKHKIIKARKEFFSLPFSEQRRIRAEWDKYYTAVQNSVSYQIFQDQFVAMQNREFGRVKELAEQSRQIREDGGYEMPKPKSFDPYELENNAVVSTYFEIDRKIKELVDFKPLNAQESEIWG